MEVLQKGSIDNLLESGIAQLRNCDHQGRYKGLPIERIVVDLEKEWHKKAHQEAEEWARGRAKSLMKHSLYSAALLFIAVSAMLLLGGKNIVGAAFFFVAGFVAGIWGTNIYHGRNTTVKDIFAICAVQNALDIWKYMEGKKYEEMAQVNEEKNALLENAKLYYKLIPNENIEAVMHTEEVLLYRTHSHVSKILQDLQQG